MSKAHHRPRLEIAILAAGFSRRLGRPKACVRVHGETLLVRTVKLLMPFAATTIMVVVPPRPVKYAAELRGRRVTLLINRQRAQGLSSSVRRALVRARYGSAVLLLPVDLAHLTGRDIARLIAAWRGARRRIVARRVGGKGAAPLILPRRLHAEALGISGNGGLKALVRGLPAEQVSLKTLRSAEWDLDNPEDLAAARRWRRLTSAP